METVQLRREGSRHLLPRWICQLVFGRLLLLSTCRFYKAGYRSQVLVTNCQNDPSHLSGDGEFMRASTRIIFSCDCHRTPDTSLEDALILRPMKLFCFHTWTFINVFSPVLRLRDEADVVHPPKEGCQWTSYAETRQRKEEGKMEWWMGEWLGASGDWVLRELTLTETWAQGVKA